MPEHGCIVENMPKNSRIQSSWLKTLGWVGNLGFQIAVPLVAFAVLGRWMDQRFGTSPWLLLAGIFLSIVVTSFLILFRVQQLLSAIDNIEEKEENPPKS